ncbi:hypothetical protein ABT096_29625 [Streptomyces sp. NPDC002561]|uniref:hypothetical protein n=1 Tax=Streptomyces sp. NPDC002561 TaxID=3154418 RepID=UPI0033245FCB
MTVEELMHALNALPLSARHHYVVATDPDSGVAYDFNELRPEPDESTVWVVIGEL